MMKNLKIKYKILLCVLLVIFARVPFDVYIIARTINTKSYFEETLDSEFSKIRALGEMKNVSQTIKENAIDIDSNKMKVDDDKKNNDTERNKLLALMADFEKWQKIYTLHSTPSQELQKRITDIEELKEGIINSTLTFIDLPNKNIDQHKEVSEEITEYTNKFIAYINNVIEKEYDQLDDIKARLLKENESLIDLFYIMNLLVLLFSVLAGIILSKLLSRPISDIAGYAKSLSKVKDSNGSSFTGDEIHQLSISLKKLIGDLNSANEKLSHQATHDILTGLPNRFLLMDRIEREIIESKSNNRKFGLLFLDLDRFKVINDTLGHKYGDLLLKSVSERLKKCVKEIDTVARLGGDEFVVLITHLKNEEHIISAAQRIKEKLSSPHNLLGKSVTSGASIGVSLFPTSGDTANELVRNADIAMYKSKDSGGSSVRYYTPEMDALVKERLEKETYLKSAISNRELYVVYQPIIDLLTEKTTVLEAFLRWKHPVLGDLPPSEFISLIDEIGLADDVGKWMFNHVCQQLKKWENEGINHIKISINLSPRQMRNNELAEVFQKTAVKHSIPPHKIELEISETIAMDESKQTVTTLENLQKKGFPIIVDDCGTGYGSMNYIKRLPMSKIKIDYSFIKTLTKSPDNVKITQAIIALAQALHLRVIAEGIENKKTLDILKELLCDEGQGYYLSEPYRASVITKKLKLEQQEKVVGQIRPKSSGK